MSHAHCSSSLTAMTLKRGEVEVRAAELHAELAELRALPAWKMAPQAQRDDAERPIADQLGALASETMSFQRNRVGELEHAYAANTPHLVQIKAALAMPERFNAVAAMAARLSESDQIAVARLLKETDDAPGAAGLCAVASGEAVAIARGAGTAEARAHLAALLRGKALLAATMRLVGAAPERVLAACAEASTVRMEDGTTKSFSDRELAELLGDEAPNV